MTAMAAAGANDKLARFRQLLDAKRLSEDESSTPSSEVTTRHLRSASLSAARTPASPTAGSHEPSARANSWPLPKDGNSANEPRGAPLDLTDEMEREHRQRAVAAKANGAITPADAQRGRKENFQPKNLVAMKLIMRRKRLAEAARRELDGGAPPGPNGSERERSKSNEGPAVSNEDDGNDGRERASAAPMVNNDSRMNNAKSNGESISLDERETSAWAMLGNHLNDTTTDHDQSSDVAISPAQWAKRGHDLHSLNNSNISGVGNGDGSSGVLSLLGESPLFDRAVSGQGEAERNLKSSAEIVQRLDEHLMRGVDGTSPLVQSSGEEGDDRDITGHDKGVTFAIKDGWQTPLRKPSLSKYVKSPYVDGKGGPMATPMNESVIVSDDEASPRRDAGGAPSPVKNIRSEDGKDVPEVILTEEDRRNDDDFGSDNGTPKHIEIHLSSNSGKHNGGGQKGTVVTPTRAALMERNLTLVKEVRFADQTCVELSERKKHYKNQAGQFKRDLEVASKENLQLRENYESSLQETAELRVLVESLRAQKHRSDEQVEAYRAQISESERTHRSSLETCQSHLKESEERVSSLNERLERSLDDNKNLRAKLDEAHGRLEAELKERVASGDAASASLQAMRSRLDSLQRMHDDQKNELQRERNERQMINQDRDSLQQQCDYLHQQLESWVQTSDALGDMFFDNEEEEDHEGGLAEADELEEYTPVKQLCLDFSRGDSSSSSSSGTPHPRTPTSNLLARTLRSELRRRQTVSNQLQHAEHQVSTLREKMSGVKLKYEDSKAEKLLLKEHIEELKVAMGKKEDEISKLKEEYEAERQREESLPSEDNHSERDTRSVLEEKLDAVEETLEFADEELTETKARLTDTQELLYQTGSELECSEQKLAEVRGQLSDYEAQVDRLTKDIAKSEAERVNLSKFSDFQATTLDTWKEKLSESDTTNAKLRSELISCFRSLVALEKILHMYEDMEGDVGKKMAEQSLKVGRLLETLQQYIQERRDLGSGAHEGNIAESPGLESSSLSTVSSIEVGAIQDQQDQLHEEILAVEAERDDAHEQLRKAHDCLEEFREELSKQESEHFKEITSLKNQCGELEAKLTTVTSDLEACKKKNQLLSKSTVDAENEVSQQLSVIRGNNAELIQENEKLRVKLESVQYELENDKALLHASRDEADGYRQDVSNARAAFECLTTESDLAKASLAKVKKEADSLREVVTTKEKELKDCQQSLLEAQASFHKQMETLNSRCDELMKKLSVEENSRLSAEASLDDASKHVATLQILVKTKGDECQEKQKESQELIVQMKQIQNALAEAYKERTESNSAIARLESDIKEKKSVIFAYEESIIGYKDEIRRLSNELATTLSEKNSRIQMLEHACSSRQSLFAEQLERAKKDRDASTAETTEMIERLQELQASDRLHQEYAEGAKAAIQELEEELLGKNEVQMELEQEIIRKQACIDKETKKYEAISKELEESQNEVMRIADRLNSLEMDCKRMATKHQDEMEESLNQQACLAEEKNQLEERMQLLQTNIEEDEEIRGQRSKEIVGLSAQNATLQKKCEVLKDKLVRVNEKNKAWEDSYKAQSDDLVLHGMEISRLTGQVSDLKSHLIRQGSGANRFINHEFLAAQTPQERTQYLLNPGTM